MSRQRSKERDKAYEIWLNYHGEIALTEIAKRVDVSASQVRKWKSQDKWNLADRSPWKGNVRVTNGKVTGRPGATPGSQRALGNRGGPGGPPGNQKAKGPHKGIARNQYAYKNGSRATIWLDSLSNDEQDLMGNIDLDPLTQLDEDITLLTIRERRMLLNIRQLKEQKELAEEQVTIEGYFKKDTGEQVQKNFSQTKSTKLLIERIVQAEEALTRVQEKRIRALEAKHRMMKDLAGRESGNIEVIIKRKDGDK